MGRKRTTGIYNTREELVEEVIYRWKFTDMKQSEIARSVRVSEATVANIIRDKK